MLSGEGNENGVITTIGLINNVQQIFFRTFLYRCFALLQRENYRNFLVTRFMEEISEGSLFTFFHCRSFSPWWPLSFPTARYKIFMLFHVSFFRNCKCRD